MAVDTRDMEVMMVEILQGKPPSLRTPEADEVRAKLKKEIEEIQAKGGTVDVPFEIPE
jgi:hypothetical protein